MMEPSQTPAAPAAPAPAPVATPAPSSTPAATPQPTPEPRESAVQRRINQLVRKNHELEARLDAASRSSQTPAPKPTPQEPKIDDFDDLDSYIAAKATYISDNRIQEKLNAFQADAESRKQQAEFAKVQKQWQNNMAEYSAANPDFAETVELSEVPITPEIGHIIMESEIGPAVLHHLAKNPAEARKIANLSIGAAARAIGKIEAAIEKGSASNNKSDAPKPITPVSGKGNTQTGPSDSMDTASWIAAERARLKAKRAR